MTTINIQINRMLVKPLLENTLKYNHPFNITVKNQREIDNGCIMQSLTVSLEEKDKALFNDVVSKIINKYIDERR